jgi:hypothetical protein
VPEQDLIA